MDVTLTKNQQVALDKFVEAMCGDEPSFLDHSRAANAQRAKRLAATEWLHRFAGLCMRIGAQRTRASLGLEYNKEALPVWKDPKTGAEEVKAPIPDGLDKVVIPGRTH